MKINYVAFAKLPENVKREIYNAYRDDTFFEMKNEYLTEIIKAFAFENIFVYNFEKFCALLINIALLRNTSLTLSLTKLMFGTKMIFWMTFSTLNLKLILTVFWPLSGMNKGNNQNEFFNQSQFCCKVWYTCQQIQNVQRS